MNVAQRRALAPRRKGSNSLPYAVRAATRRQLKRWLAEVFFQAAGEPKTRPDVAAHSRSRPLRAASESAAGKLSP